MTRGPAVSLMGIYGRATASLKGTLTGALTTPLGSIPFMRTDSISQGVTGFGDLIPQFAIRWNSGVNNYMTYITGDVPVGLYAARSMPAAATLISIRKPGTNSRQCSALPPI